MESKTANKNGNEHSQSECKSTSCKHPTFNIPSDFPRPASRSLLEDNSDEDGKKIDFSVEHELLKKQKKKKAELNGSNQLEVEDGLSHKSSHASMLDECEDNEDQVVKALEEIDSNEK